MKAFILMITLLLLAGCNLPGATDTGGTTDRAAVEVTEVIDGDTVKILYDGKETKIGRASCRERV